MGEDWAAHGRRFRTATAGVCEGIGRLASGPHVAGVGRRTRPLALAKPLRGAMRMTDQAIEEWASFIMAGPGLWPTIGAEETSMGMMNERNSGDSPKEQSFLRRLFGPSKEEVWNKLAEQVGGQVLDGGFWRDNIFRVEVGPWVVTLDSYTIRTKHSTLHFTRLRAPYVNPEGFRFRITREGFFNRIGKAVFGMQDIVVGDPAFDEAFIIKGNDPAKVKTLFANPRIRTILLAQPDVRFEVKDDEGWFGKEFPEGVDELCFVASGVVREVARLRLLYELFAETLHHLCHIGAAYEDDPQFELHDLSKYKPHE